MANTFTAHNIRLDDGSLTKPELPYQMDDLPLLKFTKRFLHMVFPDGAAGRRVVDLGCLEGGYTVELARLGFESLGIEVRQSNFENCQRVKEGIDLPNLSFACDDVHNLAQYGVFDVIFCCGLLYHLDKPRQFVELMAQLCRRAIIIDTHVADLQPNAKFLLSEITENEGWAGRWYSEGDDRERHDAKWSSWSNQKSFWLMKRDLMQGLSQAGFTMTLEYPIFDNPGRELTHRVTIVGVKD
jgi:SAM-dependent methyltransferase